jgi:putative hydrolase of the HAD superfamily
MNAAGSRAGGSRIRAIFFDFDGVLTADKTGSITTLRYLSNATGIELGRLSDAFREFNHSLNLGRTTHAAIWPALCDKLNRRVDIGLLSAAFESTPFNAGMLQLARNLRKTCSVGIITDNKADRMDCLKRRAGLSALFDPIVVSAEVGSDKESPRIFERALNHLAVKAGESVFIDNSPGNLIAPRALGMNTIYFDDGKNDLRGLAATLAGTYGLDVAGDGWIAG